MDLYRLCFVQSMMGPRFCRKRSSSVIATEVSVRMVVFARVSEVTGSSVLIEFEASCWTRCSKGG